MYPPLKRLGCDAQACLHNGEGQCLCPGVAVYARPGGAYCATYRDVRDAIDRAGVEAADELAAVFPRIRCGQGGCAHNTAGLCGAFVQRVGGKRECGVFLPR